MKIHLPILADLESDHRSAKEGALNDLGFAAKNEPDLVDAWARSLSTFARVLGEDCPPSPALMEAFAHERSEQAQRAARDCVGGLGAWMENARRREAMNSSLSEQLASSANALWRRLDAGLSTMVAMGLSAQQADALAAWAFAERALDAVGAPDAPRAEGQARAPDPAWERLNGAAMLLLDDCLRPAGVSIPSMGVALELAFGAVGRWRFQEGLARHSNDGGLQSSRWRLEEPAGPRAWTWCAKLLCALAWRVEGFDIERQLDQAMARRVAAAGRFVQEMAQALSHVESVNKAMGLRELQQALAWAQRQELSHACGAPAAGRSRGGAL